MSLGTPATRWRNRILVAVLCAMLPAFAHAQDSNARGLEAFNKGVDAYVKKDFMTARKYWTQAVEQGNPVALNNLGFLLYTGKGGAKDVPRAVGLWRRAAELRVAESQWHLGDACEKGVGTSRDLVEAYAWYRVAYLNATASAKEGDEADARNAEYAAEAMTKLLDRLPAADFAAAQKLAQEYVARYGPEQKPDKKKQ